MFDWKRFNGKGNCRSYRARIEERVSGGAARIQPGSELDAHIQNCASCSQALDEALLASRLMRNARGPVAEPSEAFVTRVMFSIRREIALQTAPGAFWRPFEVMASRFAVVATVALLALSLYAVKFTRGVRAPAATVTAQSEEMGAGLPERPTVPSNQDDVLMSLASQGQALE